MCARPGAIITQQTASIGNRASVTHSIYLSIMRMFAIAPRCSRASSPPVWPHSLATLLSTGLLLASIATAQETGWPTYGGNAEGTRYSALKQIHRGNVAQLKVAWTYDTGDAFPESEMECQPIVVDGILYATTPKLRLIALDAATGKLRWSFDTSTGEKVIGKSRNRGVTYWADGKDKRIFVVARNYLYAV